MFALATKAPLTQAVLVVADFTKSTGFCFTASGTASIHSQAGSV
jgi:hypothetical protein